MQRLHSGWEDFWDLVVRSYPEAGTCGVRPRGQDLRFQESDQSFMRVTRYLEEVTQGLCSDLQGKLLQCPDQSNFPVIEWGILTILSAIISLCNWITLEEFSDVFINFYCLIISNPEIIYTGFPTLCFFGDLVQNKGVLCVIDFLLRSLVSESYLIKCRLLQ